MNDEQFQEFSKKLDKIIGILSIQGVSNNDKKVEIMKKMGLTSYEISDLLGISNVRQMKGWKGK